VIFAMSTNQTLWWITLAVGLVVAVVVWILLERLRRAVENVDEGVDVLWTMGKRVAQNTSTTYLLHTTKERGIDLLEELDEHRAAAGGAP
jgi:type II secretory pathway component PulF